MPAFFRFVVLIFKLHAFSILYLCVCMPTCGYVYKTCRPEALDSLELELQVQLQGTELRSSEEQKMYLTLYLPL